MWSHTHLAKEIKDLCRGIPCWGLDNNYTQKGVGEMGTSAMFETSTSCETDCLFGLSCRPGGFWRVSLDVIYFSQVFLVAIPQSRCQLNYWATGQLNVATLLRWRPSFCGRCSSAHWFWGPGRWSIWFCLSSHRLWRKEMVWLRHRTWCDRETENPWNINRFFSRSDAFLQEWYPLHQKPSNLLIMVWPYLVPSTREWDSFIWAGTGREPRNRCGLRATTQKRPDHP